MSIYKNYNNWSSSSINRRIFSALITVGGLTFFVRLIEAIIYIVVAYQFGTSDELDAFIIAFLIPSFAVTVTSGAFNSSIMPIYILVRESKGVVASRQLFGNAMFISIYFVIFLLLILLVSGKFIIPLMGLGFNDKKIELTMSLFYILSPVFFMSCINRIWSTIINAEEHFNMVAIIPAIKSLVIILFLLIMTKHWGIYSFAIGSVCGTAVEAFSLVIILKKHNFSLIPQWKGFDISIQQIIRQFFPMLVGACLMGGTELVDQSMASMTGEGNVSALSYANKIVMFILVVTSGAVGTAIFPYFSKMVADNDLDSIKYTLKKFSILILSLAIPIMVIMIFFSEILVWLLFERGTFESGDTLVVSNILLYYLFQIPFYILGIMGVRFLSAVRKNHILMIISGINLILNIIGNYILIQYMGVEGISLSTTIVCMISMVMIFMAITFELRKWEQNVYKKCH